MRVYVRTREARWLNMFSHTRLNMFNHGVLEV